jgi:protein O-GlcNAc transferase
VFFILNSQLQCLSSSSSDQIASPVEYSHNYAEKFLYMPHSFLANSFSYQGPDMSLPQLQLPKNDNPSHNRCDLPLDEREDIEGNGRDGKFVYCNFNKHLKFDPDLFTHWLQTMKAVKNSYLCLLENPEESKENLWGFASDVDPDLADRIGFLPFIGNPYDNQRRNARYCSAILDTTVYNGHTTAADALWGGVPVVTRGDGMDMGSRVGASALTALGIKELIAHTQDEYDQIAVRLATDSTFYTEVRTKLIQANLASSPRNPFWDLERYVRNLESGLASVWKTFIDGGEMQHVYITDRGSLRSAEREVAFPIVFRNETDMADINEDDDEEEEETELQTSFEVVDEKKGGSKSRREGGETRRRKRDENSPKKRRRKGVNRQRRRRREKRRKYDQSDEL